MSESSGARSAALLTVVLAVMTAVLAFYWLGSMDSTTGAACGDQVTYGECLLASRLNRVQTHIFEALTFATGAGAAAALLVALVFLVRAGRARGTG